MRRHHRVVTDSAGKQDMGPTNQDRIRIVEHSLTSTDVFIAGTPLYLFPERLLLPASAAASVGACQGRLKTDPFSTFEN
jgi:hypothetical protein